MTSVPQTVLNGALEAHPFEPAKRFTIAGHLTQFDRGGVQCQLELSHQIR